MAATVQEPVGRVERGTALTLTARTFGVLAGLAGTVQALGAVAQGPGRPPAFVFESWPGNPAFALLDGPRAITLVPDLLVGGLLAMAAGVTLVVWSARGLDRPQAGQVVLALSAALLLLGGGLGPALVGLLVGIALIRPEASPHDLGAGPLWTARAWPASYVVGVVAYLALEPGSLVVAAGSQTQPSGLVPALSFLAYVGIALALAGAHARRRGFAALELEAARARDRRISWR